MVFLLIWIGVMGLAGNAAAWFLLSRFAGAFFDAEHWTETRKGRVARALLIVFLILSALLVLLGIGLLVFDRAHTAGPVSGRQAAISQ